MALRNILRLTQLRSTLGLTCGFDRRRFQLACDFDDATLSRFHDILEITANRIRSWDGRLIVVYLPGAGRYSSWLANIDADGQRDAVIQLVEQLGIEFVDIHAVFLKHVEPRTLFDGHFTKEGNALVADALLARLQGE